MQSSLRCKQIQLEKRSLVKKRTFKQLTDNSLCKVKSLAVMKKAKVYLTAKNFTYYLQSIFEVSNILQKYNLRPTS